MKLKLFLLFVLAISSTQIFAQVIIEGPIVVTTRGYMAIAGQANDRYGENYYMLCGANYNNDCVFYKDLFKFLNDFGSSSVYKDNCSYDSRSRVCYEYSLYLSLFNNERRNQGSSHTQNSSSRPSSDRLSDRERQEIRDEVYRNTMNRRNASRERNEWYSLQGTVISQNNDYFSNNDGTTSVRIGETIIHPNGTQSIISGDIITQPDGSFCRILNEDTITCEN